MGRGKQRLARKKRLEKQKQKQEQEKRLYICTYEISGRSKVGYRVQSIGLSDLCSFSDTREPMLSSKLVHQVTFLHGDEVPVRMKFGVFGSQIVLAGGCSMNLMCIRRNLPKPTYVLETRDPEPSFIPSAIPELEEEKPYPCLQEISGKLYALSGHFIGNPTFDVLVDAEDDPEWAPLPRLPIMPDYYFQALDSSTCAVLGTKLFVTIPLRALKVAIFCFDVAHPERRWTIHQPLCSDRLCAFAGIYNKVLLLDLEDKDEEKLIFSYDDHYRQIRVSSMMLSNEGNPYSIKSAEMIDLMIELPVPGFDPSSYSCAHLGGRKVCFSFMDGLIIIVFTFEFSYSPFLFKPLGCLLFDFQFQCNLKDPRPWGELAGCFVL